MAGPIFLVDSSLASGLARRTVSRRLSADLRRRGVRQTRTAPSAGHHAGPDTIRRQVVVYRLDRLSQTLRHLIDTVNDLEARGVDFLSLTESIDTSTPGGKLVFHGFGALAETDLIRERTMAGRASARTRGRQANNQGTPWQTGIELPSINGLPPADSGDSLWRRDVQGRQRQRLSWFPGSG